MKAVYIHIPFCQNICSYCDFAKMYYNSVWVDNYLTALEKEIKLNYKGEVISSIYIGGGTPSVLNIDELNRLFNIVKKINVTEDLEFTVECNVESLNLDKIKLFKANNINRVSIGIQTFNNKYLKYLNRNHTKEDIINRIKELKDNNINNINIDLIYAIPKETITELNSDIDMFLSLDIPHISTYSLLIEPNTKLYINKEKNIDEDLDSDMYNLICDRLKDKYIHYETSNFGKQGYFSKHNLVYWNNEEYYGFGIGASGYIDNIRYDNTRSLNDYIDGKYLFSKVELGINEQIENEFILGFRKLEGININKFNSKYNIDINDIKIVKLLLEKEKIITDGKYIKINPKFMYLSNDILIEFLGENYEKSI